MSPILSWGAVGGDGRGEPVPPLQGAPDTSKYPDTSTTILSRRRRLTPGYLEDPTHEYCGTFRARVICPTNQDHHNQVIHERCGNPGCPVCWPDWAHQATNRIARVIDGYRMATRTPNHPLHVSFHPGIEGDDGRDQGEILAEVLEAFNKQMEYLGIVAAAVVAHPYRIRDEKRARVNAQARRAGLNRYEWALTQPDWYRYVRFSPHIHALIFGARYDFRPLPEPEDYMKKYPGWEYRNHGPRQGDDLKRTIRYILSHAWVRGNHKVVRYWRGLSTRRLGCIVEKSDPVPVQCKECGTALVRIGVNMFGEEDPTRREPFLQKMVTRRYFVRIRRPPPPQRKLTGAFSAV